MCRRSERDLHRDHIRAYKCGNGYLQLKCRVREEGSKRSESHCYDIQHFSADNILFAQYKPKLMLNFIRCQIYKRLAIGLKIKTSD